MSDWKIPALVMPTPEQHRATSLSWLGRIQPTLIDQWPAELAALSMPTKLIKLPTDAFDMFCAPHNGGGMDGFADLVREIDDAIGWDRKFIRLNSRSPKDAPYPFEIPATISGKEAVNMLVSSERVIDDLLEFNYVPEQPAYICLRDFVYWVRGTNEFRCFVRDGKLIAVTHYDYTKPVPPQLQAEGAEIRKIIDRYFVERLFRCLPIDTVVFDVALHDGELLLIEINPYGRSDPCWFGSYEAVENASTAVQFEPPPPQLAATQEGKGT